MLFHSRQIRLSRKVLVSIFPLIFFLLIHAAGFLIHSKEIDRLALYKTSEFQEKTIQGANVKLKEIKKKQHPLLNLFYFSTDKPNILTNIYRSIHRRGEYVYNVGKDSYSEKVYFLTELEIIVFYYFKLLFSPFNQSVFPDFPAFNIEHWKTLIGALFVIVLLSTYCLSSNLRLISFSFFWYIVTIMPYTSFIPLTDLVSEHRTYLPNIGFFIAVSTGLAASLTSKKRLISLSFILAILVSASLLTLKRNFIWQSEISLWEDAVKKAPEDVKSINALGVAYIKARKNDKARSVFQKGLNVDPFNHKFHINMGILFKNDGNLDKAEEHFKLAASISTDYLAFINLGSVYLERDLYFEGIQEFNKALRNKPDSYLAYFYLGNAYNDLKDYKKAIQHFEKSIELNSDYAKAYNDLGYSYWNLGKYDEAYEWFVKAMNKQPELPTSYLNIGNYFLIKGHQKQAEDFLNRYQEKLKNEKK
jgi:tetratricopeptide (TPR) repeat protein